MTIARARALATNARRNIGVLLYLIKSDVSPDAKELRLVRCDLLRQNKSELRRLYQEFPDIKPIRTRQLNLFKKAA
jgi:hypothetical protein